MSDGYARSIRRASTHPVALDARLVRRTDGFARHLESARRARKLYGPTNGGLTGRMLASSLQLPDVNQGLLMAHVGRVLVAQIMEQPTDVTFRRHVSMVEEDIARRRYDPAMGVLYDCPTGIAVTAIQRKMLSEMIITKLTVVRRTTAAMAMATPTSEARGALRAVYWQAPPPYPWDVLPSTVEAFTFLAQHLPGMDPVAHEREYRQLLRTLKLA